MATLQELQEQLKKEVDGFVAAAIVDCQQGLPLAGTTADPNFDMSIPAGYYSDTFTSALKSFEASGWGALNEVLMPGETHTTILFSLRGGRYYQGIAFSSKTQLGIVRAIFNKMKSSVESNCP